MDKIGMVEEIKPCPFCGGEASVGKSTYAKDSEITVLNGQNVFYSVNCHSCNGRRNLIGEKSHKEAIEKWNQRVEVKPATLAPTQPEKCPECGFPTREGHGGPWERFCTNKPLVCGWYKTDKPDSAQPTPSEGLKEHTLRCPFCGELPDETDAQEFGDNYAVECPGCHASGPLAEYPDWAFGQWERRVAQGQSTARSQEGRLREKLKELKRFITQIWEIKEGFRDYENTIRWVEHYIDEALTASPEVKA